MKIAITGFGPFGQDTYNPTESVVSAIQAEDPSLTSHIFVVSLAAVDGELEPFLNGLQPDVVISLGLAGGRTAMAVEMAAINRVDFGIPDVSGVQLRHQPIRVDGPTAYQSLLSVEKIVDILTTHQVPGYVSYSAGTYLCNYLYYRILDWCADHAHSRATFVHVPYSTFYVPRPERHASMEEARMILGIKAIVQALRNHQL